MQLTLLESRNSAPFPIIRPMTCRCDKYKDEYEVIKAFQAKATRRELCDESAADFYLFSQSFADAL